MTDGDDDAVRIPIPDSYDDDERAAFRAGFGACAELFGTAAATYAAAMGTDTHDDDDDPEECPDCGKDLLQSMGADETTTPAGMTCPNCEL